MKTGMLLLTGGLGMPAGLLAWLVAGTTLGPPMTGSGPVGVAPAPRAADGVEWFWAINGPVSADAGGDMSVDSLGNVFIAGGHGGLDMDWDGIVDVPSRATAYVGANNPLFMKLGRRRADEPFRVLWVRSPGTPADRSQTKVAADGRGGMYGSGAFMESLSFEGGPTLQGAGGNDAFIARYGGDGSVVWARVFGGPGGNDAIYALASDGDANVYLVGSTDGSFPLDDEGAEIRVSNRRAAVIVSYGPSGEVRWSRTFGAGVPFAFGVRVAPDGQVYVTGELEGAVDFDEDGTVDLPAPEDRDGFVARFDTNGVFLGAWSLPTVMIPAFAPDGDLILGGGIGGQMDRRYGPADFDGDGQPDIRHKGDGPTNTWVARYSPEGEQRWIRSYTLDLAADLEVRGDMIVMSGQYKGVRDLDEDGQDERVDRTVDPTLETDIAIMILSARDGRIERVWTAPGPGNDWANAVVFLPNEPLLLVTGAIQLTADFTGDGEAGEGWIVCENLGDIYVAQYRLPEVPDAGQVQRPEPPPVIELAASLVEREGEFQSNLTWTGTTGTQVDVYRNGTLIATVSNGGSYADVIPRGQLAPPYRYRVCEAGSTTCSATQQSRF